MFIWKNPVYSSGPIEALSIQLMCVISHFTPVLKVEFIFNICLAFLLFFFLLSIIRKVLDPDSDLNPSQLKVVSGLWIRNSDFEELNSWSSPLETMGTSLPELLQCSAQLISGPALFKFSQIWTNACTSILYIYN